MTQKRRMSGFANIALCIFVVLICAFCFACSDSDGNKPGDSSKPTVTISVTGADSGKGTESDPYKLALAYDGTKRLNIVVKGSSEKPAVSVTGSAVTAVLSDNDLDITAVSQGSARVELSLVTAKVKSYIDVTVAAKPDAEFTLEGMTEGAGTESDPYLVSVAYGKSVEIAYTARDTSLAPTATYTSDAVTVDIADGKIKISGNQFTSAVKVKLALGNIEYYVSVTVIDDTSAVTGEVSRYGAGDTVYSGVTVKIVSSDYTAYSVTDEDGVYWFTHLDSDADYVVTLQFTGEYEDYVSDIPVKSVQSTELVSSDDRLVARDFAIIEKTAAPRTTIGGTVTSGGTAVPGIIVTANGEHTAVTDPDGAYEIENVFAFGDITVTANDDGGNYAIFERTLNNETIAPGDVTECDVELGLPYANYGVVCNNDTCAGYYLKYTRSSIGLEFRMEPQGGLLLGNIELFIDTKGSSYERDDTDYLISTDGRLAIVSSYGVTPKSTELITARKTVDAYGIETVYITVPYAFFEAQGEDKAVAADEVIGISLGYKVNPTWVGWVDKLSGGGRLFDNKLYIAPEHPVAYMRLNARNEHYRADGNVDVSFDGYKGSFGFGHDRADAFYVNVDKTADGIKLDFKTTGNFGGKGETDEFIALYLDLDGEKQGGWNYGANDLVVRLYCDGTVRYKGGSPWWKRDAAGVTTIDNAFTVNYENCVTTIAYTLPWSVIGITADTEFGFAFREACDSAVDMTLYGSMGEFVYDGWKVTDTAAQEHFVRSTRLGG